MTEGLYTSSDSHPAAVPGIMDSSIDLSSTWKDCERHVEQLTQLVRQASCLCYWNTHTTGSPEVLTVGAVQILTGEQGAQQTAPALLERKFNTLRDRV